jgi:hypothetical protein
MEDADLRDLGLKNDNLRFLIRIMNHTAPQRQVPIESGMKTAIFSVLLSLLQPWLSHGLISLPPLSFNMSIHIFFIQDQDSPLSSAEYNRLPAVLKKLLSKSTHSRSNTSPHSSIEFSNKFTVTNLPTIHYQSYRSLITNSNHLADGTHFISSDMLESYLSSLQSSVNNPLIPPTKPSFDTLPIFIVSPTTDLPRHKLYSRSPSLCSQTYTSDSLFVDLTALLCDYSDLIGELNNHHSGVATQTVLHDLYPPTSSTDPNNPSNVFLTASLANVVGSAIDSFTLLNDLKPRVAYSSQRIVAPIVFLKSRYAALEKEEKPQPGLSIGDLSSLQNQIQSLLLPSQTISLLTSTHYLEDHPQLTIAMAAASRWTVASISASSSGSQPRQQHLQIPYLDSRSLLSELSQIGDNLCRRLLVDAGHGLEDDSLLQIEALFQSIEMKGERLSKDEKIVPDWIRHYTPTDDYDASPHGPSRQKTQIVPIFVISDLETTGFELMEDSDPIDRNGIFPLFEDGRSVSALESVGLVLHSRESSLTVYSRAMYGGLRNGIDLSDASLSIAEILTKIVTGISPPFEVSSDGHRDLTWTAGTHPFSPYGHMPNAQQRGLSELYGTAAMRGIVLTRTLDILSEYLSLLHSAEKFSHDLSRLYQIITRPFMRLLPTTVTWKNSDAVTHHVNPLTHTAKSDILDATFSSLAFLQYIEISQKIPNSIDSEGKGDGVYVIPPEQRHMLQEMKTIVDEIIEEILSLYRMMGAAAETPTPTSPPTTASAAALTRLKFYLETIGKCEENLQILRWNYYTSENRLKQHLDMCQLENTAGGRGSSSKRASSSASKYLIAGIGFVSVIGLVFLFKSIQSSLEAKVKKTK